VDHQKIVFSLKIDETFLLSIGQFTQSNQRKIPFVIS
jgi:hypothetical protein